jgi:hypothetical protein
MKSSLLFIFTLSVIALGYGLGEIRKVGSVQRFGGSRFRTELGTVDFNLSLRKHSENRYLHQPETFCSRGRGVWGVTSDASRNDVHEVEVK